MSLMTTGAAAWRRESGGGGGDPHWASVVSLLNFGGSNGSTTFVDEKGRVWTPQGDAHIDTSQGYSAGRFDGNGDAIHTPSSADFNFGAGDFTIEAIVMMLAVADATVFSYFEAPSAGNGGIFFGTTAAGRLKVSRAGVADRFFGATVLPTETPIHVAVSRVGGTSRVFVDGVVDGSIDDTGTNYSSSGSPRGFVGAYRNGTAWPSPMNGYVRAFRITKGVGRYSGSFTPPAAPFPVGA